METKFKLGQKVWSIQLGDCEVTNINHSDDYPILCTNSKGDEEYYTLDGKSYVTHASPSLFSSNPFFEERVMEVSGGGCAWIKETVVSNINGRFQTKNSKGYGLINWFYAREISTPQIVELTLKDISEGKGVGVPVELIRIKTLQSKSNKNN